MGARLGTVEGWVRTSETTDEPRTYEGIGPTLRDIPKYEGDEVMEYWVNFDIEMYFCDSPPVSPIVVRTLHDVLLIEKFLVGEIIPSFEEWIRTVTERESRVIHDMSLQEMGGLRECGIEDWENFKIIVNEKGQIPAVPPVIPIPLIDIEKEKAVVIEEIEKEETRRLTELEELEKKKEEIEKRNVEDAKSEMELFSKKVSDISIRRELEDQEKKRLGVLKQRKEYREKTATYRIRKAEEKIEKEKVAAEEDIEAGKTPVVKKKLSKGKLRRITELEGLINVAESERDEKIKYRDNAIGNIYRFTESAERHRDIEREVRIKHEFEDAIRLLNIKIERMHEEIRRIESGVAK